MKMHAVAAPLPAADIACSTLGTVGSYMIGKEGVPHMMQRSDGLWLCEFCRFNICKRCARMQEEQQKPAPGLWGRDFECTPKCKKIEKDVRQWVKDEAMKRASEAGCRSHCPCRDQTLLQGKMPYEGPAAGGGAGGGSRGPSPTSPWAQLGVAVAVKCVVGGLAAVITNI